MAWRQINAHNYVPEYSMQEITDALIAISGIENVDREKMLDAMYSFCNEVQRRSNKDGWEMLFGALDKLTDRYECGHFNGICGDTGEEDSE